MKKNKETYIKVQINEKTGKLTTQKSDVNSFILYGGDLFNNYSDVIGQSHVFFVTSNSRLKTDCKKHFGNMLKEIDAKQKVLDKKRSKIERMIKNSKEL